MRDVAAAADVALGTVYRYFSSKERLLLEAMAEQQSDLRAYLEAHPPAEATPAARVVSVLRGANRTLRSYPDVTAAMVRAFGTAQVENADIVRRVTEIMTAIITNAIHAPERRAPTEREVRVARILMQVWLSSLNGWVCGVDGPDRVDEDLAAAADCCSLPVGRRTRAVGAAEWNVFYFRRRCRHSPLQLRRPVRARRRQGARPRRDRRRPPRDHLPRARRAGHPPRPHPRRPRA